MKGASLVVAAFEDVVDMLVHYSDSVHSFFCASRQEFLVFIHVDGEGPTAAETSTFGEFGNTGRHSAIGKFCNR